MADPTDVKNIVSFYKLDKTLFDKSLSIDDNIQKIMGLTDGYHKETKLDIEKKNGFRILIYYAHNVLPYKKWESFFSEILQTPNDTFFSASHDHKFEGSYLSFVCFFEKKGNVFAVCVGKGYMAINEWIEEDFGFNLLTRLIKSNSSLLKKLTANHLSGNTFENVNFFRSTESFLSQDDFGKIFREAVSELDSGALKKIGVNAAAIERTNCLAKSSFMLKTGISLSQITDKILPNLIKILDNPHGANFQINKVKATGKHHPLFNELKNELYKKIRTSFLDFDFFSPIDTQGFFMAKQYSVSRYGKTYKFKKSDDDLTNLHKLKAVLDEHALLDFIDERAFELEVEYITINAFDDEDKSVLRQSFSLARGMHGELDYKKNKYFWINGKFWKIDPDFLKNFGNRVFETITDPVYGIELPGIPLKKYDSKGKQSEEVYNLSHSTNDDFLILDKKTPDGVELCDLLYASDKKIYLIHIKLGFDRNIRNLASQILTAARFLLEDRVGNAWLKKLYKDQSGHKLKVKEEDFLALFKKDIVFVFAFAADKQIFNRKEFDKSRSNIAKLELLELVKDFKNFSPKYELKLIQLP